MRVYPEGTDFGNDCSCYVESIKDGYYYVYPERDERCICADSKRETILRIISSEYNISNPVLIIIEPPSTSLYAYKLINNTVTEATIPEYIRELLNSQLSQYKKN